MSLDYDHVAEGLKAARWVYARAGIPSGHRQWVQDRETMRWHPLPGYPLEKRARPAGTLEEDMWGEFGFAPDSPEAAAGYVLRAAHQLETAIIRDFADDIAGASQRLQASISMLRERMQTKRNKEASREAGKRGGRPRNEWASLVAQRLHRSDFERAWREIPESSGADLNRLTDEIDDLDSIYRDGDDLIATYNGKLQRALSKASFKKKYWSGTKPPVSGK